MSKIRVLAALMSMICFFGLTELSVKAAEGGASITEMNQVMTVQTACDARETPDENSGIVMSYEAGASIWVTGEVPGGWYRVSYQGKEGYVPKEAVIELQVLIEKGSGEGISADEAGNDNAAQATAPTEAATSAEDVTSTEDAASTESVTSTEGAASAEGVTTTEAVTLTEAGLDTEMAALEAENELIVEEVERMRSEAKRSQIWKVVIVILVIGIFVAGIFTTMQSKKKKKDGVQEADKDEDSLQGKDSLQRDDDADIIDLDKDEE